MRNTIQFQKDLKKQAEQIVDRSKISHKVTHQINVNNKNINTSISSLLKRVQLQKGLPYSNTQIVQTKRSGIPQSIITLDKICQMMGFQAMGQVKQSPGFDYLARRTKRNQNGDTYNQTFDFKNPLFIQTPELQQNMIFFAGRTIDSWNKFVKDQGQMKVYFQKIASLKNSQQYINQLARSSSIGTIRYKIMATLYYLYYDCGQNFLQLEGIDYKKLMQNLLKKGTITKVWQQVNAAFLNSSTKIALYLDDLTKTVTASFKTVLTPDQYITVQPFLMRPNAYLTLDYLNTPNEFKQKRWAQEITNQKNQNIIQVQNWDVKSMYFKSGNFLFI